MGNLGDDEVVVWEALVRNNAGACRLVRRSLFSWEVFAGVSDELSRVGLDCFKTGNDDRSIKDLLTADFCLQGVCFVG